MNTTDALPSWKIPGENSKTNSKPSTHSLPESEPTLPGSAKGCDDNTTIILRDIREMTKEIRRLMESHA